MNQKIKSRFLHYALIIVLLIVGLGALPQVHSALALTPTLTSTPGGCPPIGLSVSPVTSPTSQLTQVITARITNGGIPQYTVIAKDSAGNIIDSQSNNSGSITITLRANTTHFLTVNVNAEVNCGTSSSPIFNFRGDSKATDSNGNPLTIVQSGTVITNTPTPQADLVVSSMLPGGFVGAACQNKRGTKVTVTNNGSVSVTSAFIVRLTTGGGQTTEDQTVAGLAAGQSATVQFSSFQSGGMTATVDQTNVIAESNETNNTLSLGVDPIPSTTPPPTCTPTITPTPSRTLTCGTPTAIPGPAVDPVTSPTNALTQTINVLGSWTLVTVAVTVNGVTTNYQDSAAPFQITINLSANATHTLIVYGKVPITTNPNGCTYGGYTVSSSRDRLGNPLTIVQSSGPTPTFTATPTSTTTLTPSKTNTPGTPSTSDPCANPTVLTGGGTFAITTSARCFKYVNTGFLRGGMFSVMKDGSSASDTLQWYGGLDQNTTACSNQSRTITGNGGQLNNFVVAKDANGQMFLTITGSAANNVTISIQNWQNGNGCSVIPTVHP